MPEQQGATVWEEDWEAPRQLRRLHIYGIRFSRLPGSIDRSCLLCLCFLSLAVCSVEVQDLDNLARLPELSYLDLRGLSWPPVYTVGTDGFKIMRFCHVDTTLKFHMGAMPRLEELRFGVFAGYSSWVENGVPLEQFPTKDVIEDLDLGLDNLISLEKVTIKVYCSGATAAEVQEVEAVVTRAVENHPNHPAMKMFRRHEGHILSEEEREKRLQHDIEILFDVLVWKDEPDACFITHLRRYRHLQKAVISIDCAGASMREVEKMEAALRHAAEVHPNHPTIQLIRRNANYMCDTETHHMEGYCGVLELKDEPDAIFITSLQQYRVLQKAVISIDCAGASMCEVEKVEAALRHAAEVHPNHPTIQLIRTNTDDMVSSSDHPETEVVAAEVHYNHPTIQLIRTYTDNIVSSSDDPDTKLMCLIAKGFRRFPTDIMGNQISLEELRLKSVVGRSATKDLVVELGKQTRLRVVTIAFSEELEESLQKALVQSLSNLQELQELELSFTGLSQQGATVWEEDWEAPRQLRRLLIVGITFSQLPRCINRSRLPCLCFLSLDVCTVEVQDLDNLARLPELSNLELVGSSWPPVYTVGTDGFKILRFCHVGTALKFHMGAMPRLEELRFGVFAGYSSWVENGVPLEQFPTKDVIEDLDLGLDNLISLEKVTIKVYCSGATAAEVQEVEAVVTRAGENHPNRPAMKMFRRHEGYILSDKSRVALLQQHIEKRFSVLEWKDGSDAFFITHLRSYRHLEKAIIAIDCAGTNMYEVEKVEAACRNAAELHRNHPTIQLLRMNIDEMVSSSDHPDTELMYLIVECFRGFPANKMGNLMELRLKSVVGRSATEDLVVDLGKQTRLRVVTITFSEELGESLQKALVQSLCNLQELRELELSFTGLSQQGATVWEEDWEAPRQLWRLDIDGIIFSRWPGWINRSRLPHLCLFGLRMFAVEVQDLDNLARLPELRYLNLYGFSWPPGYTVGTDGFKNLRFCIVNTALKFHVGAMPRLEKLQFEVFAGYFSWVENGVPLEQFPTKDVIEDLDLGLDNLISLEKVTIKVDCSGATAAEVQKVEAVVTRAVENHPNRPAMEMFRRHEGHILSEEKREERLQHDIEKLFDVLYWKDEPDACFISHLRKYRHLQNAVISIDCAGASMCEVEKVEAAVRHAAEAHPNHPTIQLIRTYNTDQTDSSSDHPESEQTEMDDDNEAADSSSDHLESEEKELDDDHETDSSDDPDPEDLQLDDDHDDSPDSLLCKLQLGN